MGKHEAPKIAKKTGTQKNGSLWRNAKPAKTPKYEPKHKKG